MIDDGPLELLRVTADSEADPMRRGQIQLTVRFGVLKPIAQHEMLKKAVASGDIDMEVRQHEMLKKAVASGDIDMEVGQHEMLKKAVASGDISMEAIGSG